MKIGIISDHRGYDLRKEIIKSINNYEMLDLGAESTNREEVDYPDYAFLLGEKIINNEVDCGIAICGSGIGISIACNKVKGIRCGKVNSISDVISAKNDNDANIIAFSAKTSVEDAVAYINNFVETPFSTEERHIRRVEKIKEYEEKN